jgi:hypothetical protein
LVVLGSLWLAARCNVVERCAILERRGNEGRAHRMRRISIHTEIEVCRKCAVRFEPIRANSRFFNTSLKCFRAGLVEGKSLKRVVSAVGIEPTTY